MNPFDKFDIIYYINLDSKKYRNRHILKEFKKMNITNYKRILTVPGKFNALSCSKTHLNCLLDFKESNYKNCIIFEDDFVFSFDKSTTYKIMNNFIDAHIVWDVVMLNGETSNYKGTWFDFLINVFDVKMTSGYCVNKHYVDILIDNITESINNLERYSDEIPKYCFDQYWKVLQSTNKWYMIVPKIGYQISKPSATKNIIIKNTFKYVMAITNCYRNLQQSQSQYEKYFSNINKYPLIYFRFVGNLNLTTDYMIDLTTNLLILKCPDDYVNLPNKIFNMIKVVKKLFPNVLGIIKTDDDIQINLSILFEKMELNNKIDYWGIYCPCPKTYLTSHLKDKPYITDPILKSYKILVIKGPICRGACYFISKKCCDIVVNNSRLFKVVPNNKELAKIGDKKGYLTIFPFEDHNMARTLKKFDIHPFNVDLSDCVNY